MCLVAKASQRRYLEAAVEYLLKVVEEGPMADRKTSPKVASQAGKILSNPKSTKQEKSVAASDLAQAAPKKKGK